MILKTCSGKIQLNVAKRSIQPLNGQILVPDNLHIGSLASSILSPLIELQQFHMWAWISENATHYKNQRNLLMAHYILTAEQGRGGICKELTGLN